MVFFVILPMLKKILAYPLTVLYYLAFGLLLVIFHPIFFLTHRLFGFSALEKAVDVLQFLLVKSLLILASRVKFSNPYDIPTDRPLIIVSNHQSMYDIPPIIYYMRKHHPKFISKKELGRGIPSVSYNLRHGGSVLIDRKNPRESVKAIITFAKKIGRSNWAAVIFPEGTRSKTGAVRPFRKKGLLTLFEEIPNALVVPLSISNSYKLLENGSFPMGIGNTLYFNVHKPIPLPKPKDQLALIAKLEEQVKNGTVR